MLTAIWKNENMKWMHKTSTWIIAGLVTAMIVGAALLGKWNGVEEESQWRADYEQALAQYEEGGEQTAASLTPELAAEYEYRLQENIPPIAAYGQWNYMDEMTIMVSFITMFSIIVTSTLVAGEFQSGSVKLLFIRPVARWKLLLGKYLSGMTFAALLTMFTLALVYITGGLVFGFSPLDAPYLYSSEDLLERSIAVHMLSMFGLGFIQTAVMTLFAVMLASLFRSNAMAIGISVFSMFFGTTATALLAQLNEPLASYSLFANNDLTVFISDNVRQLIDVGPWFSIAVLSCYTLLFAVTAFISFTQRDVAI